jgi:hypothetical protein
MQALPPLAGNGLVHVRVWVSVPSPHVTVHVPLTQSDQPPSTGHAFVVQATCWASEPMQALPPLAGNGLVHVRVWVSVPSPHVTVHVPLTQSDQPPSTGPNGQDSVLQATCWASGPVHVAPPWAGAGLVHVRVWVSVPPPHVAVHVPLTQTDQPPLTASR